MKNKKKIMIPVLIFLILTMLAGTLFAYVKINNVHYITLNGTSSLYSHVTLEQIKSLFAKQTIVFIENGEKTEYTFGDLGIEIIIQENQQKLIKNFAINIDEMELFFKFSPEFKSMIRGMNDTRQDYKSAEFKHENGDFFVEPEIYGNKLDLQRLETDIKNQFSRNSLTVNLDNYKLPQPDDLIVASAYKSELDKWTMFSIKYTNGFEITKEMVSDYFYLDNNKIMFAEDLSVQLYQQCLKWATEDLSSYNTLGGTFTFTTHNGEEVELQGVTYGDVYSPEQESTFLFEAIKNLWPCIGQVPAMIEDMPDDIQSNVIEVDITNQHLWFWRDGKVLMETDVVTGTKNKHDTPHGVFQILNVIDGVYLEGPGYKSWVDKWMRIYNGYGLHDATWRNSFGGEIYKWGGSHGCINLPHEFACDLYDLVEPGQCVVIY